MLFAIDDKGNKIKAEVSGQMAICPFCKKNTRAHCGEIYINHWKHENISDCDSWHESETEWHREWKKQFPKDWSETIITKNNEKHIADILTPNDYVIEFQNSPISAAEIRKREQFYSKMIWIINAEPFNEQLVIRSRVTQFLKNVDFNIKGSISQFQWDYDNEIRELEQNVKEIRWNINSLSNNISQHSGQIDRYFELVDNIENTATNIIKQWTSEHYRGYEISTLSEKIFNQFNKEIVDLHKELETLKKTRLEIDQKIKFITSLETLVVNGNKYHVLNYSNINEDIILEISIIKLDEINSLFPNIQKVYDFSNFYRYNEKRNEYKFLIDFSKKLSNYNQELIEVSNKQSHNQKILKLLKKEIEKSISKELSLLMSNEEYLKNNLIEEKNEQEVLLATKEKTLDEMKENKWANYNIEEERIKRQYQKQKSEIMTKYKGQYTLEWKHERKSWQSAKYPLFFDLGKDYLFEKINDTELRKIKKDVLINNYL